MTSYPTFGYLARLGVRDLGASDGVLEVLEFGPYADHMQALDSVREYLGATVAEASASRLDPERLRYNIDIDGDTVVRASVYRLDVLGAVDPDWYWHLTTTAAGAPAMSGRIRR